MKNSKTPEINAGSMADIAFLLLIFFLVVTTISADKGIQRKLPEVSDVPPMTTNHKNILTVLLNANNQLLVDNEYIEMQELQSKVASFINNNADGSCSYCENATQNPYASDNPLKAIVSIQCDRATDYDAYLKVQNEIAAAYKELRNKMAQNLYGKDFDDVHDFQKDKIKQAYPLLVSEAETQAIAF